MNIKEVSNKAGQIKRFQ